MFLFNPIHQRDWWVIWNKPPSFCWFSIICFLQWNLSIKDTMGLTTAVLSWEVLIIEVKLNKFGAECLLVSLIERLLLVEESAKRGNTSSFFSSQLSIFASEHSLVTQFSTSGTDGNICIWNFKVCLKHFSASVRNAWSTGNSIRGTDHKLD
jgi:hypothetical protein